MARVQARERGDAMSIAQPRCLHRVTCTQDPELARYRDAAELIYPGLGAWSYETFDELNRLHFGGEVPLMAIQWHWTLPYGGAVGLACCNGSETT